MIHRIASILFFLFISLTIASCYHNLGKGLEQEQEPQTTTSTPQTPPDTGGGKALKTY